MALPVAALPLLAIGGSALLAPLFENYRDRTKGRYNRGLMEGVDEGDPMAVARAMFGGGRISAQEFLDAGEAQQGFAIDRFNADTSRMNANTSAGQLALANQQFGIQLMDRVPTATGPVDMRAATGQLFQMESGGNPNAVSPKGAMGVGQIMPDNIYPWAVEMGMVSPDTPRAAVMGVYATDAGFQQELAARKFQQYVQKYGLREAFVKWHAGEGTSFAQVVKDYQTGGGRYHDGNMHTYDYVMANMNGYGRYAAANQQQAARAEEAAAVEAFGSPSQKALYGSPVATPQTQSAIGQKVMENLNVPAYDPATDAQLQRDIILQDRAAAAKAEEARAAPPVPLLPQQIAETRQTIDTLEPAVEAMARVIEYVAENSTPAGRTLFRSDEDQVQIQSLIDNQVIPAVRNARDLGALEQAEYERLVEELGITSWREGNDATVRRLREVESLLASRLGTAQRLWEAGTTPRQREALPGAGHATPPGDSEGVQQ